MYGRGGTDEIEGGSGKVRKKKEGLNFFTMKWRDAKCFARAKYQSGGASAPQVRNFQQT